MRISKIHIPLNKTQEVNLNEIDLTRKSLGSTVALVGKNGAGKTRVLKFIENIFKHLTIENILEDYVSNLPTDLFNTNQLQNFKTAKSHYHNSLQQDINTETKKNLIYSYKSLTEHIHNKIIQDGPNYIKVIDSNELTNIKKQLDRNLTFEQILQNEKNSSQKIEPFTNKINQFKNLNSLSTVEYFNKLSTNVVTDEFNLYLEHRESPSIIQDKISSKDSYLKFTKFQSYVKKFLGKEFSYKSKSDGGTLNSILYLNNQPFNINLLSPGQKTLFAYAILLFYLDSNPETNIKESIIIIDEPEKHLHPEAQLLLIDTLKEITKKSGQLWIATHSINILAHLEYDEIFLLKDDEVFTPSRLTPGNSFNELMGLEKHIEELNIFIKSISDWSFSNFISQCLFEPDVVFNKDQNDPQYLLFLEFIKKYNTISILDFGAGKGRLGYTISENYLFKDKIKYSAYETNKTHNKLLNEIPNINNIYNTLDIPSNSYNCVVLCNVLHEINPRDWIKTFDAIRDILTNDGYLVILEDKHIPKGECAHEFGYLIFGIEQLKMLFKSYRNNNSIIEFQLKNETLKDRLLFTAISKQHINISKSNILNAIESLRDSSLVNIKNIRKNKNILNSGRELANQSQLYINSVLALESL